MQQQSLHRQHQQLLPPDMPQVVAAAAALAGREVPVQHNQLEA